MGNEAVVTLVQLSDVSHALAAAQRLVPDSPVVQLNTIELVSFRRTISMIYEVQGSLD